MTPLPTFITHYYEADYGPFLNVCDLPDDQRKTLQDRERAAKTGFNRFALGEEFFQFRRAADDLLIRLYTAKFDRAPAGRPFYAVLGEFDRTKDMFRDARKLRIDLSNLHESEVTFMYPDHSHLVSYFDIDVLRFGYQLPADWKQKQFFGRLFTRAELAAEYDSLGIAGEIGASEKKGWWAGSYMEAHIWKRDIGTGFCDKLDS